MNRAIAFLVTTLLLSGCAAPLVKPGVQTVDGLRLSTPVAWTAQGIRGQRLWTRDGPALNALRIFTDIQPGEHVLRQKLRGPADEGARFRAGLGAVEIQELLVDAMTTSGLRNVRSTELAPARLNGKPGFRAELACDSPSGLHYRALVLAEGEDGTLSYLLYLAPAEHYFEAGRPAVEAIFESVGR
jgi:hypothetical protein